MTVRLVGTHWRDRYTLYVDDLGVYAMTEDQICTQGRVLEAMLTVLNKPFSDKTGANHDWSMDLAGLHFTGQGVRLSDSMFASLRECLLEYEVRTARVIGHVVGLVQYCSSAFEWQDDVPRSEFATLISQLNDVSKEAARSIPGKWKDVFPPIRSRLLQLMVNRPRVYSDPATIISGHSCLVMLAILQLQCLSSVCSRLMPALSRRLTCCWTLPSAVAVTHRKLSAAQYKT